MIINLLLIVIGRHFSIQSKYFRMTQTPVCSSVDSELFVILKRYISFKHQTGGDPLGQFAIEHVQNEWKVSVRKPLDREKKDNYLLNITASDGIFTAKATVEVKVLDANDNSPVCEKVVFLFFSKCTFSKLILFSPLFF